MADTIPSVILNGRVICKHDIEANWKKATNFVPRLGELIIYDPDDNYSYPRYKIGVWDGIVENKVIPDMLVTNLPFASLQEVDDLYIKVQENADKNPVITHKTYTAADPAIKAIGRDSGGHVTIGKEIIVQTGGSGAHTHKTSTKINKDTYVTGISPTSTKLSISADTAAVLTSVPGEYKNLDTITITPVSGSTTASKATAGTAVNVATVDTAVVAGTADVGTKVTGLAKRAETDTLVGNANRATAATPVGNANVDNPVRYGTANVGSKVTVDAGKADVDEPVRYGTANVDVAVSVATQATSQSTFLTGVSIAAPTTTVTPTKDLYNASIDGETLVLTPVTLSATTTAPVLTPTTGSIYGVGGSIDITPAIAAPASQTLTPAKLSNRTVEFTPAAEAPASQTLTPAVQTTNSIYGAVLSETKIYGVTADRVDILPAKAATRKIVPAKANGTITPYTFANVTVPVAANSVTVATGTLSVGGSEGTEGRGDAVMTGVGSITTTNAFTDAEIVSKTTGDVTVLTAVSASKNAEVTYEGSTDSHTDTHNHTLAIDA
jgi:hypothetical protein